MTHGVMVALRFLVSSVKVRVLVGQQANFKNPVNIIVCGIFFFIICTIFVLSIENTPYFGYLSRLKIAMKKNGAYENSI